MRALSTPSADDGPGFHTNMPISELIERDTRAVEASVVSSAPSVAKTKDGVTPKTRPTPIRPKDGNGAVLGWIFAGFGSCGFGFGDDFLPTVFGFGASKPIGFGFGFGFPPVDIQWISEINHLKLKLMFYNMLIITCLLILLNLF